jgi:hypothetical protein
VSTIGDPESQPSEPSTWDVVDVIDRAVLIENIINQVIIGYCKPREGAWQFMWSIVLDTSILTLGAKVKVVIAISNEMDFKLEKNALHRVIVLRNAFAHHSSNAHPVLAIGPTPVDDSSYLQLWILGGSGKISRLKRHEAFSEFNTAYQKALSSLVKLSDILREKF